MPNEAGAVGDAPPASYLRAWSTYILLVLFVWGPVKVVLTWLGTEHWLEGAPPRGWYALQALIALCGLPFSYLLFRWTVRRTIVEAPGPPR